jgi:ABC-type multidrug transport system fused ATPase/permease subunit
MTAALRRPHLGGGKLKELLRGTGLGDYARVIDPRTRRRLVVATIAWIGVSLLEVVALAAMVPLIELLSGGTLADAGIPGEAMERLFGDWTTLAQTMGVLYVVVGVLVARVVLGAAVRWWTMDVITSGATEAATGLVSAYLDAPLEFHSNRNSAKASRTAVVSLAAVFVPGALGLATVVAEVSTILLIATAFVIVSPLAALAAVVYFSLAGFAFSRVFQRRVQGWSKGHDDLVGETLTQLQHSLGGLREIRLRRAERSQVELFHRTRVRQQRLQRRLLFGPECGRYFIEIVFLIGFAVIASVQLLTGGEGAFAALGVMLAAGFRILPSIGRILQSLNNVKQGEGSVQVVLEELDAMGVHRLRLPDGDDDGQRDDIEPARPVDVVLRGVGFRYRGSDRAAVHDLSIELEAGRSLGIVGSSGSGKTTTVDLICGLLLPTTGEILVDGRDPVDAREHLRTGYVPQDVYLLDGSIRENIAFTDENVDDNRLAQAVRLAQLDAWVESLPAGLDTMVGERGALVSGGQRQRIGIARALYTDPSVLILDEATSALDVETEAALTESISKLRDSVTLIVIAHRLSTVRGCDRILVLDDGRAVGLGTYAELEEHHEMFARWAALATGDKERRADVSA